MLKQRAISRKKPPRVDGLQGVWLALRIAERGFEYRDSQALIRPQVRSVRQHVGHMDPFS